MKEVRAAGVVADNIAAEGEEELEPEYTEQPEPEQAEEESPETE
jgi:hypothetical protein